MIYPLSLSLSGTGSLLLRTVHILQSLKSHYPDLHLLVPGVLCKLLREHVTQEDSSALMADAHLLCWGYDDGLVQDGKDGTGPRSITFDGKYVYLTSSSLKNFLKLGTGKQGTIRGYVYANRELDPGWVVWTKGMLIFKEKALSSGGGGGGGGSSSSSSGAAASSSGVTPSSSGTAATGSGAASAGVGGSGSSTSVSGGSSTSVGGGAGAGGGGGGTKEVNAEKFCSVIERDTLKVRVCIMYSCGIMLPL